MTSLERNAKGNFSFFKDIDKRGGGGIRNLSNKDEIVSVKLINSDESVFGLRKFWKTKNGPLHVTSTVKSPKSIEYNI